ncbi:hypothetical protein BDZ45DRAFT_751428 [Acephala macrosclerotiorum]|nr:hypothetical protein BDZ45DRAFT_751428 [Acephala macrosclerotiorum]
MAQQGIRGDPAPPALYIHSLKEQLRGLKTTFPTGLEDNVSIYLAYWHAEISSYKIGLSKSPTLSHFLSRDFDRLEYLHSCLIAVKSFFNTWLSVPVNMCHWLTVPMITHFIWSLGVLQLLATFEHPDWNLEWARKTISFTDILDKHAKKFTQVKSVLGLDPVLRLAKTSSRTAHGG